MAIAFAGTGRYLPEYVASNREFETFLDTSDEWIRTRSGIQERRISAGEPTWWMGAQAARRALEAANINPEQVDLIICSTVTGDYQFPSTACMIQGSLGASNAFAVDIAAACAGSIYGLDMARRYLATGVDTVLLVGAETLSQVMDYTDRASCFLFGDGAGAIVLRRSGGLYGSWLHSDPDGARHLYSKHPRRTLPLAVPIAPFEGAPFEAEKEGSVCMNGKEVYKFATRAMPLAVRGACEKAGVGVEDLDLIIPHQANARIIEAAVKTLGVPMDKVAGNIHKYGNTSSASVMICLDECVREERLREGDLFCMVGFGSGLAYGAVVTQYRQKGEFALE